MCHWSQVFHLDTVVDAAGGTPTDHESGGSCPMCPQGECVAQTGLSRKEHQKVPAGKGQSRRRTYPTFSTPSSCAALRRAEGGLCPFHRLACHPHLVL